MLRGNQGEALVAVVSSSQAHATPNDAALATIETLAARVLVRRRGGTLLQLA